MDISVIVPVYNIEDYLSRCVDSLVNQTVNCKYEIILVDDGSTDNSGKICDDYGRKYENVLVYHTKNKGLSEARNFGMKKASGEYFVFVDSDDYVGHNFLKVLYNGISQKNIQISVVQAKKVYEGENIVKSSIEENSKYKIYERKDALARMFSRKGIGVSAWAKMYSRELFDDVEYPKGMLYEDLLTTPFIFDKANNVSVSMDTEYFYLVRKNSISRREISDRDMKLVESLEKICSQFEYMYPEMKREIQARYITDIMGMLVNRLVVKNISDPRLDIIKIKLKCRLKGYILNSKLNIRVKGQLMVFLFNKYLYGMIIRRFM